MPTDNLSFIRQHLHDDVHALALQADRFPDVDLRFCVEQIAGRQQAARKLPSIAEDLRLLFPPKVNIEQCSGEQTAHYKANLFARIYQSERTSSPITFLDATGGFGIDFIAIAKRLQQLVGEGQFQAHYADTNADLCRIAAHNFPLLGLPDAHIHHADGIETLRQIANTQNPTPTTLLYIDPSRRDTHGRRTYDIADCLPDVAALHDEISRTVAAWVVKLSPMFDWHEAVRRLPATREVHIVSTGNECKELLLVLYGNGVRPSQSSSTPLKVVCVNDDQTFAYHPQAEEHTQARLQSLTTHYPSPFIRLEASAPTQPLYLYEPNASVMKAGCYREVAQAYNIRPISDDSHLFLSETKIPHFIGRSFVVDAISSMQRASLRQLLTGIDRANVAVRHFPLSAEALRKKLRIKDGGDRYLFGTTAANGEHIIIAARKVGK